MDLDEMFKDMLGDLAEISQQLDNTATGKAETKPVKHTPSVIPASDITSEDVGDLDAMLSDLTDWEQNLVAPSSSSGSKVSVGDDYQQAAGDLLSAHSSEMLHAPYGMDVSPQFNTLKRSAGGGPTVTYEDDDLSLENLAKDIETEKRNQDKARQMSAEELATLSPVMQELDDLVAGLSNIGFLETLEPIQDLPQSKYQEKSKTPTANNTFNFSTIPPERTNSLPKRRQSVPESPKQVNIRRSSTKETSLPRVSNNGTTQVRRQSLEDLLKSKPVSNKPKPPPKPPVSSKPQLSKKPEYPLRQQPEYPPRPPKPKSSSPPPLKRQGSAKAPENLSSILERQLQHRATQNERRASRTSTSSETTSESIPEHHPSFHYHQQQHYIPEVSPHSVAISKHSSTASVVSSLSASSMNSAKSDSSAESGSVDQFNHAINHANEKYVPDDIRNFTNTLRHSQKEKDLTPEAREERVKNEKMRIALEKLKEARIQKLVVKVFNKDDSSKTLLVDERMTARAVIGQLLEKNHYDPSVNWAIVEELPSLYMERIFEEHECVTEMLAYWTRDTTNQVRFVERKDKYALFRNPQHYLLSISESEKQLAERQKQTLIDEFFSGRSGTGVPEVQGVLYIKAESKSWTKKYCVLRSSGLYYSKSGEPKKGKKLGDLQCLVMFEQVCVYLGRGWKKKYKSPTDYGFSLKHPAIQTKSKHIRYFCCDDVRSLMRWIVGIRCAKYGKQLKDNYDRTDAEMKALGLAPPIVAVPPPKEESADSGPTELPRPSITNVFGGAWQKANQEEAQNKGGEITRTKSVWNSSNTKSTSSTSNWWALGPSPEMKDLADETISAGPQTGATHSNAPPTISTSAPRPGPPPPGAKPYPSRPGPPPLPSKKPSLAVEHHENNRFPAPPPVDDMPPPPPLDDMPPPPPPMDDMPPPPPPIDDEMPLPPPMPLATGRTPPRFSGHPGDPQPVRLPMLPVFQNRNNNSVQSQSPPKRPGPPPPSSRNYNASNNKATYRPDVNRDTRQNSPPVSPPRPPLTAYYTNSIKSNTPVPFAASDLPPAPEFVTDLKDTFYKMSNGVCDGMGNLDDFPPPPPELLLTEVKSRRNQMDLNKAKVKSAPPPPRRSASTKLSFKRK